MWEALSERRLGIEGMRVARRRRPPTFGDSEINPPRNENKILVAEAITGREALDANRRTESSSYRHPVESLAVAIALGKLARVFALGS
jgi:hypothetical protein